MLTVAEDIFQDVETATMLLNGEVVRRAFKVLNCEPRVDPRLEVHKMRYGRRPQSCCPHAELLEEYKKTEGIVIYANQRILNPLTEEEKRWKPVWMVRQNQFAHAEECCQKRDELRARLNAIRPCSKCQTGRNNYA